MSWAERVKEQWTDDTCNWTLKQEEAAHRNRDLVAFLSRRRWDVFWTQTFRHKVSAFGAQASFLRCLAERNSHSTVTAVMWAVEPHANFPSHHVHALLQMRLPLRLTNWPSVYRPWKEHCWRTLGKALILPTSTHTPIWYVMKYVNKTPRNVEWMKGTPEKFWGVLTGADVPSRVR